MVERSIMNNEELLGQPADTAVKLEGTDALHIPIEVLEEQLDTFRSSTDNFVWRLYANETCVAASIKLTLNFYGDSGEFLYARSFVGGCNFSIASIAPIPDWLATAKSLCIKNAAADAGRWLGRFLNEREAMPERPGRNRREAIKMKPDAKIMQKYMDAIKLGDDFEVGKLTEIYDFKIGE